MINSGQQLWERAKKLIPGGNQLLSKRPQRFLPGLWPTYYEKAKGCEVWDLDGCHYYDFAQMGVGSCILGYADPDVNQAVINAIQKGSMSSLNCYEEIELAELLIDLHPWAEMVRFARTGGEACAIAVRIARAATGRSRVAFCGYHGWHDWYISANINNGNNLDDQLLPGLKPRGVPKELEKTALPFRYNHIEELENIVNLSDGKIAAIIMEPQRSDSPKDDFLIKVRKLADKTGAVLIFDEITSGFRVNVGGIHLTFNVMPDIALFGKAMSNGYPMAAIVGRRSVMDSAQDSFISSTYWSERIGPVAALATIRKMEKEKVPKYLVHYGDLINQGWQKSADQHKLRIKIGGIEPLTHLSFLEEQSAALHTLYAQYMLEKGYLVGDSVYTTFAYTEEIIKKFAEDSSFAFFELKKAIDTGRILSSLKGDVKNPGFARLA